MAQMRSKQKMNGFTMIELLVTLAVAAIVLGMAVPAFDSIIVNNRIASQTNDYLSAMAYARSEAVKRSANVSLIAKNGDWSTGYTVEQGGTVLRDYAALSGNASLVASGGRTTFTFGSQGMLDSATDVMELCHSSDYEGRIISITGTGMSNVGKKNDCV